MASAKLPTLLTLPSQHGKRLNNILIPDEGSRVTAVFEDGSEATGSLLVGCDGAHSKVREFLFGAEQSALQKLPLMGLCAVESLPAELARKIREINELYLLAYHPDGPEGVCVFTCGMSP